MTKIKESVSNKFILSELKIQEIIFLFQNLDLLLGFSAKFKKLNFYIEFTNENIL